MSEPLKPIQGPVQGIPKGPKVNGRKAFLAMIDAKLADSDNIHKLAEAVQHEIDTTPGQFIREIVMPLTPNSMLETDAGDSAEDKARKIREALAKMEQSMGDIKQANESSDSPPAEGSASA